MKKNSKFSLMMLILLFLFATSVRSHECIHNKIMANEKLYRTDPTLQRNLETGSSYSNIRITTNYSSLSDMPTDQQEYIIKSIEVAKEYLQETLKVIPVTGNNIFPTSSN